MERVASAATWVRYDARGFGLSSRDNIDFSLAAAESDLDTVVNALGLERFALMSAQHEAMPAIAYAAHHPERVSALVLWLPIVNGVDVLGRRYKSLMTRARADWATFVETLAATMGWERWATSREFIGLINAAMSREITIRFFEARRESSVVDLLPRVTAPTLVLGRRELSWWPPEYFGRIAAEMPNASHRTLEGASLTMTDDDVAAAIGAFLLPLMAGEQAQRRPNTTAGTRQSAFRTVLFTDLVGHTEMMQRLGDERGRDVLREHERITRETLKQFGGAEVKTMGDGFLASFGSVTKAMDCAIALQRAFAAHSASMPEPLQVRVGLNAGEPIEEDGDLFGSTVILASRIAAKAGAGEILIPEPLRHLLSGKSYVYADRGETLLKGFEDAVRLYEVRWREEGT
jgi:class 3 adenylate cyclase